MNDLPNIPAGDPRSTADAADTPFAQRLAAMQESTGLNAAQLGVTRVYATPRQADDGADSGVQATSGHLAGEEVLIKDLQQVAGEHVTMGSIHQGFIAQHSDTAAQRLLTAGAHLVGASSTAEYGTVAYTEPIGLDAPVNPINPAMMTGGSSGGAATAVARGLVRIAHATDGGGSIRVPAAACGLIGLKPVHDSTVGGFTPVAHGFLADSFVHTRRAYQLPVATPKNLRIGYTNTPFHQAPGAGDSAGLPAVDPTVAAATAAVTGLLTTTGAVSEVVAAPRPYDPSGFQLFAEVIASRCADLPGRLSPMTAWLREQGRVVPGWRREKMETGIHGLRDQAWQRWDATGLDIVATPMLAFAPPPPGTFSQLAPRLNFWGQTAWTPWATLWNLSGWASVTVPLVDPARVPGRWPIALQLGAVGQRVSEAELLTVAEHVQQVAQLLNPLDLSIAEPGQLTGRVYQPMPRAGHDHEHGEAHANDPAHSRDEAHAHD